jgi:hypothetical protein
MTEDTQARTCDAFLCDKAGTKEHPASYPQVRPWRFCWWHDLVFFGPPILKKRDVAES